MDILCDFAPTVTDVAILAGMTQSEIGGCCGAGVPRLVLPVCEALIIFSKGLFSGWTREWLMR